MYHLGRGDMWVLCVCVSLRKGGCVGAVCVGAVCVCVCVCFVWRLVHGTCDSRDKECAM